MELSQEIFTSLSAQKISQTLPQSTRDKIEALLVDPKLLDFIYMFQTNFIKMFEAVKQTYDDEKDLQFAIDSVIQKMDRPAAKLLIAKIRRNQKIISKVPFDRAEFKQFCKKVVPKIYRSANKVEDFDWKGFERLWEKIFLYVLLAKLDAKVVQSLEELRAKFLDWWQLTIDDRELFNFASTRSFSKSDLPQHDLTLIMSYAEHQISNITSSNPNLNAILPMLRMAMSSGISG